MTDRVAWTLAAVLALVAGLQAHGLSKGDTGFGTLPIFVPLSLEHERQLRAERAQPPGDNGEQAVRVAEGLIARQAALEPTLRPKIEAVRDARAKLLDARDRRHALNVRLMDVGVAVTATLTPAQWDSIHMRRDALRAEADAEVFDRVLQKVR